MSIEIARPQRESALSIIGPAYELAKRLAATEFVPDALRNRPEAVLAAILYGREVGLGEMTSLAQIHVIRGRPALSAFAQRALIMAQGHEIWPEEMTETRCVLLGLRRGSERDPYRVTWTIDMAKKAGLLTQDRPTWFKFPRAMLLARSTGELARLGFADVIGGMPYNSEEIDDDFGLDTAPAELEQTTNGTAKPERKTRRRSLQQREAPPPPPTIAPAVRQQTAPESPPEPEPPAQQPTEDGEYTEPAAPPEPQPPTAPQPETGGLTLKQQIAMRCREAGLSDDERRHLISAVTGKTSREQITREDAMRTLDALQQIIDGRGELIRDRSGHWLFVHVRREDDREDELPLDESGEGDGS